MTENTSTPKLLPFVSENVPQGLRRQARWAPWAGNFDPARQKWNKVPRRLDKPQWGLSVKELHRWAGFDTAMDCYSHHRDIFSGLGYCMSAPVHGIVGVDLDNCLELDGSPQSYALEIIRTLNSYTERSPSGNGLRVMVYSEIKRDWVNNEMGIEVYGGHGARFLTITGHHLPGTSDDLQPVDPQILENLFVQYGKSTTVGQKLEPSSAPDELPEDELPDVTSLELNPKALNFLLYGETDGDGSNTLFSACIALYRASLTDAQVYSLLILNDHAMGVALNHRSGDDDKAREYIWVHHCMKAKEKMAASLVTIDDFEVLPSEPNQVWPKFERDKHGKILARKSNLKLALECEGFAMVRLRYDDFRGEIVYANLDRPNDWQRFTDEDYTRLGILLERRGFKNIGRDAMRDVVALVALENRFDTAQVWLGMLPWDGVRRIEMFLHRYLGAEDVPYIRAVSQYLWTGLAGRILEPGIKTDMVPILVGAQGVGKSSAVGALVPSSEFFCEISLQDNDDNLSRMMRGKLVAELGELRGMRNRELEATKAFITRRHEKWVPKYKEFATEYPRRLMFIGTTNQEEFLDDSTGNRRWLPVRVSFCDRESIVRDRELLWAEAREVFKQSGIAYQAAEELAPQVHQDHTVEDAWTDPIRKWCSFSKGAGFDDVGPQHFRVRDVLHSALGFEDRQIKKGDEMRVSKILQTLGCKRTKVRDGASTFNAYLPPQEE